MKAKSKAKPKKSKRGGRRPGAGRPRDRLPQDVIDRIGTLAADATGEQIDTWARRVLSELVVLQMRGEVGVELAASIRATCGEVRRSIPKPAAAIASADADDDQDDEEPGGQLELDTKEGADNDGALRVE